MKRSLAIARCAQLVVGLLYSALTFAAAGPLAREYFGFHAHRLATTTAWPSLPFGSWRLWDAYVAWPYLETERGKWDFAMLDKYIAMAERRGVELLLPLGLSPTWASSRPSEASAYKRPGWASEPAHIEDWRNYVRTVATRYRGKIRHYEIWNEPNLTRFFSGSVAAMVELTCEAARVVKAIDPTATIVSPSATDKERGVQWLRAFMQAGGDACVDIVGFHFYTYAHEEPEAMVAFIRDVRDLAARHAKRAVWNTETGWYFANQRVAANTKYRVQNADQSAAYIVRAFVLGASMGVERFFWYAWDNAMMGGLIEPDTAAAKPAVNALRGAMRWLIGTRIGQCTPDHAGVWICPLSDEHRVKAWIAWRPGGPARWPIPQSIAAHTYETLFGQVFELARGESVALGALPILLKSSAPTR